MNARLEAVLSEGEEIFVWGAGLHTSTLLDRTTLDRRAQILAITDRDRQKHGRRLGRHAVVEPETALQSGRKIIISSFVSEQAIAASLAKDGVSHERIVRLYS